MMNLTHLTFIALCSAILLDLGPSSLLSCNVSMRPFSPSWGIRTGLCLLRWMEWGSRCPSRPADGMRLRRSLRPG